MERLKVVLMQLPLPKNSLLDAKLNHYNVPIAAGYLKAMAHKYDLLKEVDIEILNSNDQDLSGDKRLINVISAKKPDILGMSLYSWNSTRSLYIAGEVKKNLPSLKVIIGGPQVHPDEPEILNNPAVDIAVMGEGELTFCELLKHFLCKNTSLEIINGIAFKENNQLKITSTRPIIEDLNQIPSPYLLGFLNPKEYGGLMLIGTQRGCPFQCKYCSWGIKGNLRTFSLERVKQELQLFKDNGINSILFLDSNFNFSKNFKELCEFINQIDLNKQIKCYMFLKADSISEDTAELLSQINAYALLGLQTTNKKTKSAIDIKNNENEFIQGVNNLIKKGIECDIELILGLPEETRESYGQTIDFLKENKFIARNNNFQKKCNIICFPLSVFPGTLLKKEALGLKLKFQQNPPYRIIETSTMSFRQIKKSINAFKDYIKLDSHSRFFAPVYLTTYFNGTYPVELVRKSGDNYNKINKDIPVTKIILDLKNLDCVSAESLREIASNLANVVTIWFVSDNLIEDKERIKRFLHEISVINPYIMWNIFIETSSVFPVSVLQEIKESLQYLINVLDYEAIYYFDVDGSCPEYYRFATQLSVILKAECNYDQNWLDNISLKYPTYWSIFLNKIDDGKLSEYISRKSSGILLDFSLQADISFILNALKYLSENNSNRLILFKNWVIQRIWDFEFRKYIDKLGTEEHVIKISGNQVEALVFEDNKLLEELKSWVKNRRQELKV